MLFKRKKLKFTKLHEDLYDIIRRHGFIYINRLDYPIEFRALMELVSDGHIYVGAIEPKQYSRWTFKVRD